MNRYERWAAVLAVVIGLVWIGNQPQAQNQQIFGNGASVISTQVANNTTAVSIKTTGGGVLYSVDVHNNSTTLAWAKYYDATSQTCGSGTPKARLLIPASTAGISVGLAYPLSIFGDAYANGIMLCVTTGFADSDTTAPAATTYVVNSHFR